LKRLFIIVNPISGKGKSLKILPEISKYLTNKGYGFETYHTQNSSDYSAIKSRLSAQSDWYAILILGGDGTLNDVINSLPANFDCPFMVIPCGSGNDFASWLYGNLMVQSILNKLDEKNEVRIDIGECNGKRFINGVGIGYDGWVAREAEKGVRWLSPGLKYHLAILRGLFTFKPFESNFGKALILAVANGPTYGGGFRIAPGADPSDHKLNLWHIKPISVWMRPYYLSIIKKGSHSKIKGPYETKLVDQVTVECQKSMPAHMDGEYFEAQKFEIKLSGLKVVFIK